MKASSVTILAKNYLRLFPPQNAGYQTLDLLCVRFILLLIVTGWLGRSVIANALAFDPFFILELVGFSIISVVIPVFTLQLAIEHLNSTQVSSIIPIIPVIALCGEMIIQRFISPLMASLIIAITCAIAFSVFLKDKI